MISLATESLHFEKVAAARLATETCISKKGGAQSRYILKKVSAQNGRIARNIVEGSGWREGQRERERERKRDRETHKYSKHQIGVNSVGPPTG